LKFCNHGNFSQCCLLLLKLNEFSPPFINSLSQVFPFSRFIQIYRSSFLHVFIHNTTQQFFDDSRDLKSNKNFIFNQIWKFTKIFSNSIKWWNCHASAMIQINFTRLLVDLTCWDEKIPSNCNFFHNFQRLVINSMTEANVATCVRKFKFKLWLKRLFTYEIFCIYSHNLAWLMLIIHCADMKIFVDNAQWLISFWFKDEGKKLILKIFSPKISLAESWAWDLFSRLVIFKYKH
jgi:hypothetical protein